MNYKINIKCDIKNANEELNILNLLQENYKIETIQDISFYL